uniref:hypothetical protein n=1 Tax=Ensifer adhaerens TaxID=106592 RepID=UPI003F4945A2
MKSPWKFLIELASRGRAIEERDTREAELIPTDVPSSALSLSADNAAAQSKNRAEGRTNEAEREVLTATPDTLVVDIERTDGIATPTGVRPRAEDDPRPLGGVHRSRPKKRRARAQKPSVKDVAEPISVEYGDVGVSPSPTFFDEVAALDEQIKHLKGQLAVKLLLQNAQLKRMLERYDAS